MLSTVLSIYLLLPALGRCYQLPPLYWNSTNPLFSKKLPSFEVRIRDRIDIHCPQAMPNSHPVPHQYLKIHMVPQSAFYSCQLAKPYEVMLQCRDPHDSTFITLVFREYTPNPQGFEFTPGNTYYLISTSNGSAEGMDNNKYGLCSNFNMKLAIKVLPKLARLTKPEESIPYFDDHFSKGPMVPQPYWRSKFGSTKLRPIPDNYSSRSADSPQTIAKQTARFGTGQKTEIALRDGPASFDSSLDIPGQDPSGSNINSNIAQKLHQVYWNNSNDEVDHSPHYSIGYDEPASAGCRRGLTNWLNTSVGVQLFGSLVALRWLF